MKKYIALPSLPRTSVRHALMLVALLGGLAGLAGLAGQAQAQPLSIPQATPGLMPNAGAGAGLYARNCSSCHGERLQGSDKGPPFLHRVYEPSHHGDAAFQLAVKSGVRAHHWQFGDMPPVAGVSPDEVAHIIAFIRAEQRRVGIH